MTEVLHLPPAKTSYLPGLNTLRAYAALAVIFSHISENIIPLPPVFKFAAKFFIDAQSAVSLFFVLSGFLITYLLLHEFDATGTVSVRKFYIRRALRIWPLYYLVATVGLLLFPFIFGSAYISSVFNPDNNSALSASVKTLLAFCLLPNFASLSAPMIHLWSIGVEEQFYAAWPWVFRQKLNLVLVCVGIIIIKISLTPILSFLLTNSRVLNIFNGLRFECMAVGALGAYCYKNKLLWLKFIYHSYVQLFSLIVIICLAIKPISVNAYTTTGISICFIILILNIATNSYSLIKLDYPLTERLGQISYGLYLYHFPILYLCVRFAPYFFLSDKNSFYPIIISSAILGLTWLISELSYRWFEVPFLNLKGKFTTIQT